MARRRAPLLRRLLSARDRSLEITKAGWLFIGLTLLVGFSAVNSGSNLLHAIFGAQMALVLGSGLLSEATLRRVRASRHAVGPVFARTPSPIEVELENVDRRADAFSVSLEDDDRFADRGSVSPAFAVCVPRADRIVRTAMVTLPARGRHPLPPAVLATRFPFGLFVKRRVLAAGDPILVFPALARTDTVPDERPNLAEAERTDRQARVGEIWGLRQYRPGDETRFVHWLAVARTQQLVIREHASDGAAEVVLELPVGRSGEPEFERTIERLAGDAVRLAAAGDRAVGLRRGGDLVVAPGTGPETTTKILTELALAGDPA